MITLLVASVFLNGVNVDGLRSQSFEKCKSVKIDDHGDLYLDCPGYEVQAQAAPIVPSAPTPVAAASMAPAATPGVITKHYWMVSEDANGAQAQYDLDVFVNSKWVRKIKAGEPQIVVEITRYLQPGQNKVLFAATKHMEGGRKTNLASSFLKITVGEGESGGNTVMIDNPLIEVKRTAAETDNINEEFTLQAR
ncbi:MAG: hypothetical protein ABR567_22180 [Myxococcales bacterium]|nr:hypothetical protein [Myxococcales bacterium]